MLSLPYDMESLILRGFLCSPCNKITGSFKFFFATILESSRVVENEALIAFEHKLLIDIMESSLDDVRVIAVVRGYVHTLTDGSTTELSSWHIGIRKSTKK